MIDEVRVSRADRSSGFGETTTDYTYNVANQLVGEYSGSMTKVYAYDASGNNTAIVETAASGGVASTVGVTAMTYDGLNRMTGWTLSRGGEVVKAETHSYRGNEWHRRGTSSTDAGGVKTTGFLYDGDNVLCDYVSTGGGGATFARLYVTPFLDQNLSMTLAVGDEANTTGSE
jgi:hypothetical protein